MQLPYHRQVITSKDFQVHRFNVPIHSFEKMFFRGLTSGMEPSALDDES